MSNTKTITFDERTEKNLATLLPPAADLARKFLLMAQSHLPAGVVVKIISGSRTPEEQADLYAQGRTKPGSIVTNAEPWESLHNYKIAVDIGFFRGSTYLSESPLYDTLGAVGEAAGLEWGGRWHKPDKPHYQLPVGFGVTEMKRRHDAGIPLLKGTKFETFDSAKEKPVTSTVTTWTVIRPDGKTKVAESTATDDIRFAVEGIGGTLEVDSAKRVILVKAKV